MTQGETASRPLNSRDFRGGPVAWLLGLFIVGALFLAGKALVAFPLLDPDPTASFVLAGAVSLIAFAAFVRTRRKLMPWGPQAPFIMWGGLASFAVFIGYFAWALVGFSNGALDPATPHHVRYTILDRYRYNGDFFLEVEDASLPEEEVRHRYSVEVSEIDWEASEGDSTILLDVRPGLFGFRWVAGHQLCRATVGSC